SADIILLNKTDLMSSEEIVRVKDFLIENNRCAKIIETTRCDVHPNLLQASSSSSSTAQIAALISEEDGHHHNHVKDGISSIKVEVKKTLNKKDFIAYLQKLPKNILRLKGIVQFKGEKNQSIVQYVNGRYELIEQENRQKNEAFLVFIGQEMQKSRMQLYM
ncbi:MAG: GTP-binding protein, partial [Campylobacteraceae bacterium]|nr:GTP-binding protein [Campylobacteraceae bacterium]